MKVTVLRKFRDKHNGSLYLRGDVLNVTVERYDEILRTGKFVAPIEPRKTTGEPVASDTINYTSNSTQPVEGDSDAPVDSLNDMTVSKLKAYANEEYKLTFPNGTKKADIVDAIRRMMQGGK